MTMLFRVPQKGGFVVPVNRPLSDEEITELVEHDGQVVERERAVEHGRFIRKKRLELGLKRPAFVSEVEKMGHTMSSDYLNKLEAGTRHLTNASPALREAIRIVLGLSLETWKEKTGLYTPSLTTAPDPDQSALDLVRLGGTPINAEYPIPMLGDVAAGGRNTGFPNMQFDETIDAGRELAERYGISYLYALRVTGDSMYSERARFSVPDGSTLIVHRELEPVRGDIVVAYIEDLDLGVVKEYGEPEDVTLSSYNPTGPLYRANQHRIRLCGVVVEARHKPRTRRNGTH